MLKFMNKGAETPAARPQGITAAGNPLRQISLRGLGLALTPLLLGFAYLLLIREPLEFEQQVDHLASAYATQQATTIGHFQQGLRSRLQAAAASPLAQSAVAPDTETDVSLVEQAMLDYFPDVVSLEILPIGEMGTAPLSSGSQGLRNHIEVDLVRRTAQGNPSEPESYQFEGKWLTSFAVAVTEPQTKATRGVLIVTVDNALLTRELTALHRGAGRFAIEQRVGAASRVQTVAASGSGAAGADTHRADIPGTPWQVAFTPSEQLLGSVSGSDWPLLAILLLCAAGAAAGIALPLLQLPRLLADEASRIIAAADKKTSLELQFEEFIGLAKQLRRATLRSLRRTPGRDVTPVADSAEPADTGSDLGSPVYGNTGILVEEEMDDEVLDLDLDEEPATQSGSEDFPTEDGFPAHIFRAYDIRGLAEEELSDDLVAAVGGAIGTLAKEKGEQTLIVGCDGRQSSPRIKSALVRALMECGRDVIDIGVVSTPMLYFATHYLQARSGVMVTGSHNPADYNGLKIVIDRHTIAAGGIQEIRKRAQQGRFPQGSGRTVREDVTAAYIDEIAGDVAVSLPLKIVVDAGNGATGPVAPTLLEEVGCEVVPLHCRVDGRFPNHSPDTSNEDNLSDLIDAVQQHGADFGVAFDGDGDRVAAVTGSGQIVRSDVLMMIFARDVVSRNPGADVVFDVKCTRNLAGVISENGGRPVLWKTGHAFMKEKMLETGALLGGEFSGHIFFGERWFGFDDGLYAAARLAEILSTSGQTLDEALAEFPATVNTPEILVPLEESRKFSTMEAILQRAEFPDGKVNTLDGLRVDFPRGWGLLRASNTSAALTARFEADSEADLERVKAAFRQLVDEVDPSIELPF